MVQNLDYYARLGLNRKATPEEIRRAHRWAVRRSHPDINIAPGDTQLFLQLQEAYEVLSDPQKKAAYDADNPAESRVRSTNVRYSRLVLPASNEPQLIYVLLELTVTSHLSDQTPPPLNVCLVIDRSTSMQGERMDTVKATAIDLVRHLGETDILSIVAFGDRAEVLLRAGSRQEQRDLETSVQMLQARGGTEICYGLEAGLNEVRRNLGLTAINHVILLTDGHTYGDEADSQLLAEQASAEGIGITCLGIGSEWNDVFLDSLAARTGGGSMYVSKPADIEALLQQKFRRLNRVFAERVTFDGNIGAGVELCYAMRLEPEAVKLPTQPPILLGNISRDACLSILLEFRVAPLSAGRGQLALAEGYLTMNMPTYPAPLPPLFLSLTRPIASSPPAELPPQAMVQAMAHLTHYRMQEDARKDISRGDITTATRRLGYLATHLLAQGKHDLARTVLQEARNLERNQEFSGEGEKEIEYRTRVNGIPVPPNTPKPLAHGDVLSLGKLKIQILLRT